MTSNQDFARGSCQYWALILIFVFKLTKIIVWTCLVALQPTKLSIIIEGARAGSGQPIQAEAEAVAVCHTHAQANQDLQQRLQGLVRSTKAALSAAAEAAVGSEQQGWEGPEFCQWVGPTPCGISETLMFCIHCGTLQPQIKLTYRWWIWLFTTGILSLSTATQWHLHLFWGLIHHQVPFN